MYMAVGAWWYDNDFIPHIIMYARKNIFRSKRPKIVILKVGLLRVNNAHHGIFIIGIVEG